MEEQINIGENLNTITVSNRYLESLANFVRNMGRKFGQLKDKHLDIMTSPENIKYYVIAFTHKSVNKYNNYEIFEQLGDLCVNKFVVWHAYRKFPQITFSEGHQIAARVKITFGSKNKLGHISKKLNFNNYILVNQNQTEIKVPAMEDLLEDTFESFIGATEYIFDKHIMKSTGYCFIYKILEGIFSDREYVPDFLLDFYILTDPVSNLKELCERDDYREIYPKISYPTLVYESNTEVYQARPNVSTTNVYIQNIDTQERILIGTGTAKNQQYSRIAASKDALVYLEQNYKFVPRDKYETLLSQNIIPAYTIT